MENAIEVKNLCKTFKVPAKNKKPTIIDKIISIFYRKWENVDILKSLSFSVKPGEFVGYVGKNGAGKSTTIKCLAGILTPTSGSVRVIGFNPIKDRYKYTYNIGAVFGQRRLLEYHIPVKDSLEIFKEIYELSDKEFKERIKYFSKILKIDKLLHIPVRKLSLGERMRCEIAAALLHKPKVVFLDEPTIGLDAIAKEEIRNFLKRINREEKTTIILTTHDMDDIEEMCERIILIDNGEKLYDGSLYKLKEKFIRWKALEFEFIRIKDKKSFERLLKKTILRERRGNYIRLNVDRRKYNIPEIVSEIMECCEVTDLTIKEPRLEVIIKEIYKDSGKLNG